MQRMFLSLVGLVTLFSPILVPVQSAVRVTPALQAQAQTEAETFFGTILKDGENFVLSDSGTKTKYTLDNPQEASRYEGMTVRVTGRLDVSKNVIHVETIQQIRLAKVEAKNFPRHAGLLQRDLAG